MIVDLLINKGVNYEVDNNKSIRLSFGCVAN